MTRDETLIFMGILKTAYPRYYINISKDEAIQAVALWHEMFEDVGIAQAKLALKKYIASSPFPPSVSDIRTALTQTTQGHIPDEGEAWGEVINAIRLYGYINPERAYASMNELTRLAVKRMSWQSLCESENEMADRAHFMAIYKTIKQREMNDRHLPLGLKKEIELSIARNIPVSLPVKEEPKQIPTQEHREEDLLKVGEIIKGLWA